MPALSSHYRSRQPSPIRQAQILSMRRPDVDRLTIVNLAIGNVSLPAHPAMLDRMKRLGGEGSPFAGGAIKYTPSIGLDETRRAFLHIIASAGCDTTGLDAVVTDGGSMAMELMILGVAGPGAERPILMLDPTYSNYVDLAKRAGVRTIAAPRRLGDDVRYTAPDPGLLDRIVAAERPVAIVVIPADNPTGQFVDQASLDALARLATEHDLWICSDEAYRQLNYDGQSPSSIWAVSERAVPGVTGRRISIESASKVWNACGLRVGALVTDSGDFHAKALAEFTANLSANAIGQWIFGALAHVPAPDLAGWYERQRSYYRGLMRSVTDGLRAAVPRLIVSKPEAALYSVLDMRDADRDFDSARFVRFCAEKAAVAIDGRPHTLLLAPMTGFQGGAPDPAARSQMRLAYVEGTEVMAKVPRLFAALLEQYRRTGSR